MMLPFPQMLLAVVDGRDLAASAALALPVVAAYLAVLATGLAVSTRTVVAIGGLCGRHGWSSGTYALAEFAAAHPHDRIVLADWGFASQLHTLAPSAQLDDWSWALQEDRATPADLRPSPGRQTFMLLHTHATTVFGPARRRALRARPRGGPAGQTRRGRPRSRRPSDRVRGRLVPRVERGHRAPSTCKNSRWGTSVSLPWRVDHEGSLVAARGRGHGSCWRRRCCSASSWVASAARVALGLTPKRAFAERTAFLAEIPASARAATDTSADHTRRRYVDMAYGARYELHPYFGHTFLRDTEGANNQGFYTRQPYPYAKHEREFVIGSSAARSRCKSRPTATRWPRVSVRRSGAGATTP